MNAHIAFRGDPAVKAHLLDRIDRHLVTGTLAFGETAWDGVRGSALGVSIEGTDVAAYAALSGYPVALATLLDPLAAYSADGTDRVAFVRNWVAVVRPGADLSHVPAELMLHMLADQRVAAAEPAIAATIVALHRRDRDGDRPPRAVWAAAREAILALPRADAGGAALPAIALLEASAWPAASGRSSLTSTFFAWRALQAVIDDPAWSADDEARKDTMLSSIREDEIRAGTALEHVDFHRLFVARDADLAERFIANLGRVNALVLGAAGHFAMACIDRLGAAR